MDNRTILLCTQRDELSRTLPSQHWCDPQERCLVLTFRQRAPHANDADDIPERREK
jgi:hypothetical protein